MNTTLYDLGWTEVLSRAAEAMCPGEPRPARVLAAHRTLLDLAMPHPVTVPRPRDLDVATGDWVLLRPGDPPIVVDRLPRRGTLERRAAGSKAERQVVAAHVDVAFLVTAMNRDFNPRRLERYVAAAAAGGIQPVIVLSKADLDLANQRRYVAQVPDVPVVVTSAVLDLGMDELVAWLQPGRTVCFVGSSGVGKSTLVNALFGQDVLATAEARGDDDRGRHTTTHRQLLVRPEGGVLVDTPGMRELGLVDAAGLVAAFPDIEALTEGCRFRDCGHGSEPGCAVQAALAEGSLDPDRWKSWGKLQREAERHEASEAERRAAFRARGKLYRRITAERSRRR